MLKGSQGLLDTMGISLNSHGDFRYPYSMIFSLLHISFFFIASLSASSPSFTNVDIFTSRNSSNDFLISVNREQDDRIAKCKEIFKGHFESYTLRTRFSIPEYMEEFYAKIFTKAVRYASKLTTSFAEVILDSKVGVPFHCFLLEYFLKVLKFNQGYSQFIRFYSEAIALNHSASLQNSQVINLHVFPLLIELVLTGNFLNYSFLLSTFIMRFDEIQKNQIYSTHFRQYFSRLNEDETPLEMESFKCGVEFLNLYIPRYELWNLLEVKDLKKFALKNPFGYYLIAFNPLRVVIEERTDLTEEVLEKIKRTPLIFGNEFQFLCHLENFLISTNFLNYTTFDQFEARKTVFNSLISLENVLLLVNLGLISCFRAWIQLQYSSIDDWTMTTLKAACYESSDSRFKLMLDALIN